jgi:hypothetical protein
MGQDNYYNYILYLNYLLIIPKKHQIMHVSIFQIHRYTVYTNQYFKQLTGSKLPKPIAKKFKVGDNKFEYGVIYKILSFLFLEMHALENYKEPPFIEKRHYLFFYVTYIISILKSGQQSNQIYHGFN